MKQSAATSRTIRFAALAAVFWLLAFFAAPFLIVVKISFSQTAIAQPPYAPVIDFASGWAGIVRALRGFSAANYASLIEDPLYIASFLRSLEVASIATVLLLILGYPIAHAMARAPRRWRGALLLLAALPFWTAFLIRIYAWVNILQRDGLLNQLLMKAGLIEAPLAWLATDAAVYIGLAYTYLPFMVLPLYASLESMDESLREAAADLGASPAQTFWRVTLPLSAPGMAAGSLLCFIPIVGEFVVPDLLGGSANSMLGQTLWAEFFANRDWPVASAVAVVMLIALLAPIVFLQREQGFLAER